MLPPAERVTENLPMTERALLMAIMEPVADREDEFNDWYDLEHLPQMGAIPGILSATRFVAVDGWPTYLAVYDLADFSVLRNPAYRALTGAGFTPWSRRNLSAVRGWQRLTFIQQPPGPSGLAAGCGALLVCVFRETPDLTPAAAAMSAKPGVIQARAFGPGDETHEGAALLIEAGAPASLPADAALDAGAVDLRLMRFSARYVRYARRDPFAGFHAIESGRG